MMVLLSWSYHHSKLFPYSCQLKVPWSILPLCCGIAFLNSGLLCAIIVFLKYQNECNNNRNRTNNEVTSETLFWRKASSWRQAFFDTKIDESFTPILFQVPHVCLVTSRPANTSDMLRTTASIPRVTSPSAEGPWVLVVVLRCYIVSEWCLRCFNVLLPSVDHRYWLFYLCGCLVPCNGIWQVIGNLVSSGICEVCWWGDNDSVQ